MTEDLRVLCDFDNIHGSINMCSCVVSFILFDRSYFLSAMFIAVGCRPESFGVHSDDQEKKQVYIKNV